VDVTALLATYGSVAALAAALTVIGLAFTKNAAVVVPITALTAALLFVVWATVEEGRIDKFVAVAFGVLFIFALSVSAGILFLGRSVGIGYFQDKNAS